MAIWYILYLDIWYILWPFGLFMVYFMAYFSRFGMSCQEKSGNPVPELPTSVNIQFKPSSSHPGNRLLSSDVVEPGQQFFHTLAVGCFSISFIL
jgi:hypothetical protein